MSEIKSEVHQKLEMQSFSNEEKAALIKELEEFQELQQKGARYLNKAAALDQVATVASIGEEISLTTV
jgi:hypothetical protein